VNARSYRRPLVYAVVGGLGAIIAFAAIAALWSSVGVSFSLETLTLGVDLGAVSWLASVLLAALFAICSVLMVWGVVALCVVACRHTYEKISALRS